MAKRNTKSYSKFTFEDLKDLGLEVVVTDLFKGETIVPVQPSTWLTEALRKGAKFSLNTEKAKSEFIIAPILNELHESNQDVFAVYSGFNFNVDVAKGLQGFCDFLLAKLPLKIVPDVPIIAVVEAKLNDVITAAVPQCAAVMYAARLWNEKHKEQPKTIYGVVTTGNTWLFLRYKNGMTIEADSTQYSLTQLETVLGVWQHIINTFK
jgi:hypothetical protein